MQVAIFRQHRDPVAIPDTMTCQHGGKAGDGLMQFPPGELPVIGDDRNLLALGPGVAMDRQCHLHCRGPAFLIIARQAAFESLLCPPEPIGRRNL